MALRRPAARRPPARLVKALGVASLVGVAATGAVVARGERQRRSYTPEQVRRRLHERHAETMDHEGPVLGAPD